MCPVKTTKIKRSFFCNVCWEHSWAHMLTLMFQYCPFSVRKNSPLFFSDRTFLSRSIVAAESFTTRGGEGNHINPCHDIEQLYQVARREKSWYIFIAFIYYLSIDGHYRPHVWGYFRYKTYFHPISSDDSKFLVNLGFSTSITRLEIEMLHMACLTRKCWVEVSLYILWAVKVSWSNIYGNHGEMQCSCVRAAMPHYDMPKNPMSHVVLNTLGEILREKMIYEDSLISINCFTRVGQTKPPSTYEDSSKLMFFIFASLFKNYYEWKFTCDDHT